MKNNEMPIIEANGDKFWFSNGLLHRIDGPALERANGTKSWYINDEDYGDGDIPPTDYTLAALAYEGMSK